MAMEAIIRLLMGMLIIFALIDSTLLGVNSLSAERLSEGLGLGFGRPEAGRLDSMPHYQSMQILAFRSGLYLWFYESRVEIWRFPSNSGNSAEMLCQTRSNKPPLCAPLAPSVACGVRHATIVYTSLSTTT